MGSLTLPDSGTVYLDSNCFIYSLERIEPYYQLLLPLWELAHARSVSVVSSELVRMETLVKPLKVGDEALVNLFRALFASRDVSLIPLTADLWDEAARLRASVPSLRTPDAIHATTALSEGCVLFVTNDPVFRRVPDLTVALLRDCLT
jgi:uncharacterized protein